MQDNPMNSAPGQAEENGLKRQDAPMKQDIKTLAEDCARYGSGACLQAIHASLRGMENPSDREAACDTLAEALYQSQTASVRMRKKWYALWVSFAAEAEPGDGADEYWQQLADIYDGLREADCARLCHASMPFLSKGRKDKANGKRTLKRLGEIFLETCQEYDRSAPNGAPLDFWLLLGETVRGEKRWAYCFNIFDKGDRMYLPSSGVNAKVLNVPPLDVFHASTLLQDDKYKSIQEAGVSYRKNGSRKEIVSVWLKEMKFIPS